MACGGSLSTAAGLMKSGGSGNLTKAASILSAHRKKK